MLTILKTFFDYLLNLPVAMVKGWDRFFFTPADPIMLGVIRIMVGSILLYVHLTCLPAVLDFIGPQAWVDEETFTELHDAPKHHKYQLNSKLPYQFELDEQAVRERGRQPYGFSIWFLINDPQWVKVTYYIGVACVAMMMLGLFTRVTSVLSWAFHLSYMHRAMMIWFGMDAMFSFMLLYLAISPCGTVLSLDRWIANRRNYRPVQPMWLANTTTRMIQIHISIVYFIAGIAKLQGTTWWSGSATWLTMNSPMFNEGLDIGWLTDPRLGEWFWHYFCFASTYATLAFEIAFPFLIWNRTLRPWLIFCAFVLHLGIALFMGLGGFGMIMLSACFSFIRPAGMRWLLDSLLGRYWPAFQRLYT